MSYESSQFPGPNSELQATLKLLAEIESGAIESLECPSCHANMVSVWFTLPCPNEYRTWLICGNCEFGTRVQNSERPRSFSEDRVNESLEQFDQSFLNNRKFSVDHREKKHEETP